MRMLDNTSDRALEDILVLLTRKEALILKSIIEQMLAEKEQGHYHFLDMENFTREITLGLYDEIDIDNNTYIPRVIKLLKEDK